MDSREFPRSSSEPKAPVGKECIFCNIVDRKAPASIVYEDTNFVALMSTKSFNVGHVLVIPKRHIESLGELNDETGAGLFRTATRVAVAIRKSGLRCDGINLLLNEREPFQEILHLHLHAFPRFRGDKFRVEYDRNTTPSRDQLDETAKMIREVF